MEAEEILLNVEATPDVETSLAEAETPQADAEVSQADAGTSQAEVEISQTDAEAPQEEPAEAASPAEAGISPEEVDRMVEEAYRRGRNESIAELMARPGMFQPGAPKSPRSVSANEGFLANRRPSIWDR